MTSAKERYRLLCQVEKSIPVFIQDWWLDAVCGKDHWDILLSEKEGEIVGAMPLFRKSIAWVKLSTMPVLASNWGPWIRNFNGQKSSSQLNYEHQVMGELLDQLPYFHYFNQRFRSSIQNGLPFYWRGYSLQTRYTYVIENLENVDTIYENFNTNVKRQIKKAEKITRVVEGDNIEQFYTINTKTFQRQGVKIPYSLSYIQRMDDACREHQCRKILLAVDSSGNIHASLYLLWDDTSAYYLMGGTDPDFSSGSFSMLMWEAIKTASALTKRFDFEGSMIESIERYFRSFGARQMPYLQIQKTNSRLLKLLMCMKSSFH